MKINTFVGFLIFQIFIETFLLRAQNTDTAYWERHASPLMFTPESKAPDTESKFQEEERNEEFQIREMSKEEEEDENGGSDFSKNAFASYDLEQQQRLRLQWGEEEAALNTILHRGYLLNPAEFDIIAGPSRGWVMSRQRNELVGKLGEYRLLQTDEERKNYLSSLENLLKDYLKVKEEDFQNETKKDLCSPKEIESVFRKIDACQLLLRGIDEELSKLNLSVQDSPQAKCQFPYHSQFCLGALAQIEMNEISRPTMCLSTELKNDFDDEGEKEASLTMQKNPSVVNEPAARIEQPFVFKIARAVREVGASLFYNMLEGRWSALLETTCPPAVQKFRSEANIAHIDASRQTYVRELFLKQAQEKTPTENVKSVHRLWCRISDSLLEEEKLWEIAITSYKKEREQAEKAQKLELFLGTPREALLQKAENKKKIAADHLLWAEMYRAESSLAVLMKDIPPAEEMSVEIAATSIDATQSCAPATEPCKSFHDESWWKKLFEQLTKTNKAWAPLFSRVAVVSKEMIPKEWESYFPIGNLGSNHFFYANRMEAFLKACRVKEALQKDDFENAGCISAEKPWDELIKNYITTKNKNSRGVNTAWEEGWQESIKEAEYQKCHMTMNNRWISVKERKAAIERIQSEVNKITNSSKTSGSEKEVNQLVQLWKELKAFNNLLQESCNIFVEEAEKLRGLNPERFDLSIYKNSHLQHAYSQFKKKETEDLTKRVLTAMRLSHHEHDEASELTDLKKEEEKNPGMMEHRSKVQQAWNNVVTSYLECSVPQDWKPTFYFGDHEEIYNREGGAPLHLTIDVKQRLRFAMKRYNSDDENYKVLEEMINDSCPEREKWKLELKKVIRNTKEDDE